AGPALLVTGAAAMAMFRADRRRIAQAYALAAAVAAVLILPEALVAAAEWPHFTERTDTVLLLNKPEFRDRPAEVLLEQTARNVAAFWVGAVNNTPRYTPLEEPLLDWITGGLVLVGLGLSMRAGPFRAQLEVRLFAIVLLPSWFATEVLTTMT